MDPERNDIIWLNLGLKGGRRHLTQWTRVKNAQPSGLTGLFPTDCAIRRIMHRSTVRTYPSDILQRHGGRSSADVLWTCGGADPTERICPRNKNKGDGVPPSDIWDTWCVCASPFLRQGYLKRMRTQCVRSGNIYGPGLKGSLQDRFTWRPRVEY